MSVVSFPLMARQDWVGSRALEKRGDVYMRVSSRVKQLWLCRYANYYGFPGKPLSM